MVVDYVIKCFVFNYGIVMKDIDFVMKGKFSYFIIEYRLIFWLYFGIVFNNYYEIVFFLFLVNKIRLK